ncbi:hypothetical protein P7K49_023694 [Saguinus oedipus]|uniref:Uncharacterized protein n=1 Tax=Saguinus oedipus TaxID=9490 RepID=A0ABQ9UP02_SAGOE|nr:hypothetical protein P7K49_023694 [Saguinus oedipus]
MASSRAVDAKGRKTNGLETDQMHQKAIFADEDGSGDSDDEEEISEPDILEAISTDEPFASEDESEESSSLSAEEEDLENEDTFRKKVSEPSQVGSGQELE